MPSSILPDKIYFSISEVSNHFGVATSLLRYWETEFDALKPKRNKKGRRFYSKQDIELIHSIYQLVKIEGHTLEGAKHQLKSNRKRVASKVEVKESLLKIKQFLTELRDSI
ncbi:MAG: MerR family transcriptional regulator [Flavobacteriales bacterium]|nr:MerR family transcriptional regulator [Flavobacteriales bacterium]